MRSLYCNPFGFKRCAELTNADDFYASVRKSLAVMFVHTLRRGIDTPRGILIYLYGLKDGEVIDICSDAGLLADFPFDGSYRLVFVLSVLKFCCPKLSAFPMEFIVSDLLRLGLRF